MNSGGKQAHEKHCEKANIPTYRLYAAFGMHSWYVLAVALPVRETIASVVPSTQTPVTGLGVSMQPQKVPGACGGGEGGGGPAHASIVTAAERSSKPIGTVQVKVRLSTPLGGKVMLPTL